MHFLKAIEVAKEVGAKGMLGLAYLDLGTLYGSQKKSKQAKKYLS